MGCGASRAARNEGAAPPRPSRAADGHGARISPLSREGSDGHSEAHDGGGKRENGSDTPALFSGDVGRIDRWTFRRDVERQRRLSTSGLPPEMTVAPFTETEWDMLSPGDPVWPDDLPPGMSGLNRFKNVLPNPFTRVVLAGGGEGGDYINANYIRGARLAPNEPSRPRTYIATQGPLAHTVGDFWRMVWQEGSRVIVCVTGLSEGGRVKCERYWPANPGEDIEAGDFRVTSREMTWHAGVALTKLEVQPLDGSDGGVADVAVGGSNDGGGSRVVWHFHHSEWPDHTNPTNPRSSAGVVLQLLAAARRLGPKASAPWVVHCSAGVGRSGTIITIDFGLDLLTSGASCDVAKIIAEIRRDRAHMVASYEQAAFARDAITLYAEVYNKSFLSWCNSGGSAASSKGD